MPADLFRDIVRFLAVLEPSQQELEGVYARRLLALASADAALLNELAATDTQLQQKLRRHLKQRAQLLATGRRNGFKADSLQALLSDLPVGASSGIDTDQHGQATRWMKQIEQRSWKLRRDSWVNWTVVTRSLRQCQEMRQIIATAGERSAAGTHDDHQPIGGGTLLDAKV